MLRIGSVWVDRPFAPPLHIFKRVNIEQARYKLGVDAYAIAILDMFHCPGEGIREYRFAMPTIVFAVDHAKGADGRARGVLKNGGGSGDPACDFSHAPSRLV